MTGTLNHVLAAAFLAAGMSLLNGNVYTLAPAELVNRPANPFVCAIDDSHRRWSSCEREVGGH